MTSEPGDSDPFGFLARADTRLERGPNGGARARGSTALGPEDIIDGTWCIKTRIARGAFGVVFEAARVDDPTVYAAIKVMAPEPDPDDDHDRDHRSGQRFAQRFAQEAEVSVAFDHPHIVRTWGHGQLADGACYLVMELLEGETLAERLRPGHGLDFGLARRVLIELGRALDATHAAGILHRDLKPANVFLAASAGPGSDDVRWCTKLIDFGLCKGPAAVTASSERVGTLRYMAPEVLVHGSRATTARADIYALALVAHEALTGSPAFDEADLPALLRRICHGPAPVRASSLRPLLPVAFDEQLARGLARQPEARPASAAGYGRALAAALALSEPTSGSS